MSEPTAALAAPSTRNPRPKSPLLAMCGRRPDRQKIGRAVRLLTRELETQRSRYAGGLAAEKQSLAALETHAATESRKLILSRTGRPIDLVAILRQRKADGLPVWALADPSLPLGPYNGAWYAPSSSQQAKARVGGTDGVRVSIDAGPDIPGTSNMLAGGLPALPARVRALAVDAEVRKHAAWVGVLYRPDEWRQINPDPALVVEWRDLPGRYFALAVWGSDRAAIMEFSA